MYVHDLFVIFFLDLNKLYINNCNANIFKIVFFKVVILNNSANIINTLWIVIIFQKHLEVFYNSRAYKLIRSCLQLLK